MLNNLYQQILAYKPFDEREKTDQDAILSFMLRNEDCLSRDNKIAHFATSAWIVNQDRTKVLMIYHNIYKTWAWVGGHADDESDLFQVIKREIEEETGLKSVKSLAEDVYGLSIVPVNNHIKRGKIVNAHLHLDVEYLFEANESCDLKSKPDENSGVRWIDIEKVNDCVTDNTTKPIYDRLTKKMLQYKY